MAVERTLCIIKPDVVARNQTGQVLSRLEQEGFKVLALRMIHMSRRVAEAFYAEHKDRPFFEGLVTFMVSGPSVVVELEGEDAIARYRQIMGATDSRKAADNTLRKLFGTDNQRNAVHGSDKAETARRETAFFFAESDVCVR
jgi:nucleoside-diphosphate kinase